LSAFLPSAGKSLALNAAITSECIHSIRKISVALNQWAEPRSGANVRVPPTTVAAYYDLALACRRLQSVPAQPESPTPLITTLSGDFYRPEDISAIIRWLDIEPNNAMALVAVGSAVLQRSKAEINQALQALQIGCPAMHAELIAITQEIILAQPGANQRLNFRGASSFALWGAIALNPRAHQHWWDYVPSLVHESAHSVLFGLARKGPLVLNDPSDRFVSPLRSDPRPMDGIYHAAFVSAREAWVLSACIADPSLSGADFMTQKIIGSWAAVKKQSLQAFYDCVQILYSKGRLTDLGQEILKDSEVALAACQ